MDYAARSRIVRRLLLALFVFSHLATPVAMASATKVGSALSAAEMASYQLPDGSLPVFCLTDEEGEGRHLHDQCKGCCCTGAALSAVSSGRYDPVYVRTTILTETYPVASDLSFFFQARAPPIV